MERKVSRKRYIVRLSLALSVLVVCCLAVYGILAKAAPINTGKFDDAEGVARYIVNSQNYYIDMEKTGLLEVSYVMYQFIANLLWGTLRMWGVITTVLFYFCMDFNLADLFGGTINALQSSLMGSVFKPLFSLGFCGAVIVVLKNLLRRDAMGILSQFGKVIGVWFLSMLLVNYTGTMLSSVTGITKEVSKDILVSMGGGSINDRESYATQMADVIWNATVHQPWVYIEFMGGTADEETIEKLLAASPVSPIREKLVNDDASGAFNKGQMVGKISFILAYSIPFVLKCFIYIALSVITLVYQFFAVFYVLLAPVMLILMLFPGYERAINTWIRKLIETQVGILLLTMVLGLLVKMDDLLYTRSAASWGWLIVLVVQSGLELVVLIKRKDITAGFSRLQKSVSNPNYAAKMIRDGSVAGRGSAVGSFISTAAMVRTAGRVGKVLNAVGGGAGKAVGAAASGVEKAAAGAAAVGKAAGGKAKGSVTNRAASHASAAERSNAVTAPARPKMSDCPANVIRVGPVQGHLERLDAKPEPGSNPQTRPTMATQHSQAITPLERPGTGQMDVRRGNIPPKATSGKEASTPLPSSKLQTLQQESPKQEPEKQKKVETSGSVGRAATTRQAKATQRRETIQTTQAIPKGNVASRLQKEHTAQTAKVERPSSSVKKS